MIRALRTALPATALAVALAVSGCTPGTSGAESGGGSGDAVVGGGARPLDNPDGTRAGLGPIGSEKGRAAARELIGAVSTKGRGPKTGYDRDEFGYAWMDTADGVPLARNGCDTRNDLLARDGKDLMYRSGSDCVVVAMTLDDPYTATTIEWRKQKATAVQIDHVIPLSYGWQMGAARWGEDKRKRLANDPLNLLPVSGPANGSKSDSGPASWLPPNKRIRCSYVTRFAQVALKYEMPVTAADKSMMLRQCGA
ncbi:HNH endonuclease family protein [Streptomyces spiramyceticus]|uniref:HNH endonuclease family protein n=1 Tax=Streptomyces spiramyceticus TaxID=299717 RepID=UPI00237C3973|nr:HNH endonuclease family protein [Streptomyces spiramyceticus]